MLACKEMGSSLRTLTRYTTHTLRRALSTERGKAALAIYKRYSEGRVATSTEASVDIFASACFGTRMSWVVGVVGVRAVWRTSRY
jgi:hypothetical protein